MYIKRNIDMRLDPCILSPSHMVIPFTPKGITLFLAVHNCICIVEYFYCYQGLLL
jgi:hypothetical protein